MFESKQRRRTGAGGDPFRPAWGRVFEAGRGTMAQGRPARAAPHNLLRGRWSLIREGFEAL
jgi:hypothetical protein